MTIDWLYKTNRFYNNSFKKQSIHQIQLYGSKIGTHNYVNVRVEFDGWSRFLSVILHVLHFILKFLIIDGLGEGRTPLDSPIPYILYFILKVQVVVKQGTVIAVLPL